MDSAREYRGLSRAATMLPREHGAYGQVAFPILTAFLVSDITVAGLLIAAAVVAGFLAHEPAAVLLAFVAREPGATCSSGLPGGSDALPLWAASREPERY